MNEAAENQCSRAYRTILDGIATLDTPLVLRALPNFGQEEVGRSGFSHPLKVSAISRGRGDRAARLMIEHTLQARDKLVAAFESASEESRQ